MKRTLIRIFLILGYCIPFVFLAMNEDVTCGTLWLYLVMIIGFGLLCYVSTKSKNTWIVFVGNFISFASSCIFTYYLKTEKWGWYFKPFTPFQSIMFETVILFIIQIVFVICNTNKSKEEI